MFVYQAITLSHTIYGAINVLYVVWFALLLCVIPSLAKFHISNFMISNYIFRHGRQSSRPI